MKKILFLMLVFVLLIPVLAENNSQSGDSEKIPSITEKDLECGWYYGSESQKKPGTPDDWTWTSAGKSSHWSDSQLTKWPNCLTDSSKSNETKTERQLALAARFGESENANPVRIAVHTLLAMENRTGGIGKNISAIAKDFDNSKDVTNDAEKKIAARSGIRKFFFGGDVADADKIEKEIVKNNARIAKLNSLLEQCTDCTDADKATIQEKITAIEQENTRLQTLATAEKKHKGLFGWFKRNK